MSANDYCAVAVPSVDLLVRLETIVRETVIDSKTLSVTNPKSSFVTEPRNLEDVLRKFLSGHMVSHTVVRAIRRALESSHRVEYPHSFDAADAPVLALSHEVDPNFQNNPEREAVDEIIGVLRFSRRIDALFAYLHRITMVVGALAPTDDIEPEVIIEVQTNLSNTLKRTIEVIEGNKRFDAKSHFVRAERFLAALKEAVRDELLQRPYKHA